MCVIIYRQPGVTIPTAKLESACLVNADGMGLAVIDRGKMELRKFFEKGGNNPDTLQKFLEDAADLPVFAHLRYRTKGATDKSNVHPFGVLTSKKHGVDVQFMHNGTLSNYGTTRDCDSKHFTKKFLTPLAERFITGNEPSSLLRDDLYTSIVEKYAGGSSVFLLFDNAGNHYIANKDIGKDYEGWWASNEYSFNRYHRAKDDGVTYFSTKGTYYGKGNWERDTTWREDAYWETKDSLQETKSLPVITLPDVSTGTSSPPFDDGVPSFETAKKEAAEGVAKTATVNPTNQKRRLFIEVAEIDNLSLVTQLSSEAIKDLIDEYPEEAYLLIRDLIKELYDRDIELDEMADAKEAA